MFNESGGQKESTDRIGRPAIPEGKGGNMLRRIIQDRGRSKSVPPEDRNRGPEHTLSGAEDSDVPERSMVRSKSVPPEDRNRGPEHTLYNAKQPASANEAVDTEPYSFDQLSSTHITYVEVNSVDATRDEHTRDRAKTTDEYRKEYQRILSKEKDLNKKKEDTQGKKRFHENDLLRLKNRQKILNEEIKNLQDKGIQLDSKDQEIINNGQLLGNEHEQLRQERNMLVWYLDNAQKVLNNTQKVFNDFDETYNIDKQYACVALDSWYKDGSLPKEMEEDWKELDKLSYNYGEYNKQAISARRNCKEYQRDINFAEQYQILEGLDDKRKGLSDANQALEEAVAAQKDILGEAAPYWNNLARKATTLNMGEIGLILSRLDAIYTEVEKAERSLEDAKSKIERINRNDLINLTVKERKLSKKIEVKEGKLAQILQEQNPIIQDVERELNELSDKKKKAYKDLLWASMEQTADNLPKAMGDHEASLSSLKKAEKALKTIRKKEDQTWQETDKKHLSNMDSIDRILEDMRIENVSLEEIQIENVPLIRRIQIEICKCQVQIAQSDSALVKHRIIVEKFQEGYNLLLEYDKKSPFQLSSIEDIKQVSSIEYKRLYQNHNELSTGALVIYEEQKKILEKNLNITIPLDLEVRNLQSLLANAKNEQKNYQDNKEEYDAQKEEYAKILREGNAEKIKNAEEKYNTSLGVLRKIRLYEKQIEYYRTYYAACAKSQKAYADSYAKIYKYLNINDNNKLKELRKKLKEEQEKFISNFNEKRKELRKQSSYDYNQLDEQHKQVSEAYKKVLAALDRRKASARQVHDLYQRNVSLRQEAGSKFPTKQLPEEVNLLQTDNLTSELKKQISEANNKKEQIKINKVKMDSTKHNLRNAEWRLWDQERKAKIEELKVQEYSLRVKLLEKQIKDIDKAINELDPTGQIRKAEKSKDKNISKLDKNTKDYTKDHNNCKKTIEELDVSFKNLEQYIETKKIVTVQDSPQVDSLREMDSTVAPPDFNDAYTSLATHIDSLTKTHGNLIAKAVLFTTPRAVRKESQQDINKTIREAYGILSEHLPKLKKELNMSILALESRKKGIKSIKSINEVKQINQAKEEETVNEYKKNIEEAKKGYQIELDKLKEDLEKTKQSIETKNVKIHNDKESLEERKKEYNRLWNTTI